MGMIRMKQLQLDGKVDTYHLPDARLRLRADSLFVNGRLPKDTVALGLDRLEAEGKDRRVSLAADAKAFLSLHRPERKGKRGLPSRQYGNQGRCHH